MTAPSYEAYDKPKISDKTSSLAIKRRQKMLGDKPNATLVEILLIPKHDPKWIEDQKRINEEKANDGCSFRPKTLTYSGGAQRPVSNGGDRNTNLYNSKTKGWIKDKVLKTASDCDFEKY
jgi:hypothetical protein